MRRGIAIVISVVLAVWLVTGTHLEILGAAASRLSANVALIAACGLAASYIFRAMRIYDEFRRDARGHFGACLRIVLIHNAMVNIMPLRGGEVAFPLLVRSTFGTAMPRAVSSLLWFRLQDVLVVGMLAAVAWPGLPLPVRIAGAIVFTAIAWSVPRWARAACERAKKGSLPTKLVELGRAFADSTRDARQGWFWTLANWLVKLAAQACLFAALLGSDLARGVTGTLGAELSAFLPVQGVAGFGTYEAGAAASLLATGICFEDGVRAAFVVHLFVVTCALFAGAIAYLSPSGAPIDSRVPGSFEK
jgi:Lysylphosphatidylglycerol synthase TM region